MTMRFGAHSLLAIGLSSVFSLSCFGQSQADFRNANWGMTKAEVLASEARPPSDVSESKGELLVRYDSIRVAGLDGAVVYIFAEGKLARAKYLLNIAHGDLNDFITDYHTVEPLLLSYHGEPSRQRAVWEDDSLQEERKSYLDQDRALPENIFPSDRLVGLSVSLGHLKLYTEWNDGHTKILHALTGADGRITHQIDYRPAEPEVSEEEASLQDSRP